MVRKIPFDRDVEIVGDAQLTLTIQVNKPDATVFVYLLEHNTLTGQYQYLTEGHLRLIHRKLYNQSVDDDLLVFRTFRQKDAQPMPVNQPEQVTIFLQPIAYKLRKGNSLVLSIAGWDKDNFDNVDLKNNVADQFTIFSTSTVKIPILQFARKNKRGVA